MEPWLVRMKPNESANIRLICFPFAGGSATFFTEWCKQISNEVEVCAVQLPGRQKRIAEPPLTDVIETATELATFVEPFLDKPIAVFGDCTGAFLAFEFCRLINEKYKFKVEHLFISCCRAPHIPYQKDFIYDLEPEAFKEKLKGLGVAPDWLLENEDVFLTFLPLIRADFKMVETYIFRDRVSDSAFLNSITAFTGDADDTCTTEEVREWGKHALSNFRKVEFSGSHNISETESTDMIAEIEKDLKLGNKRWVSHGG